MALEFCCRSFLSWRRTVQAFEKRMIKITLLIFSSFELTTCTQFYIRDALKTWIITFIDERHTPWNVIQSSTKGWHTKPWHFFRILTKFYKSRLTVTLLIDLLPHIIPYGFLQPCIWFYEYQTRKGTSGTFRWCFIRIRCYPRLKIFEFPARFRYRQV